MAIYTFKGKDIFKNGYGIISKEVITSKKLTMGEKVLYAYFSILLSNGNIELPSFEKIAKDLNINEKMAKEYFDNLVKNGYIEKTDKED